MKPIYLSILTLILAGVVSYATTKALQPKVSADGTVIVEKVTNKKADESVYERVIRTGKIRCGYATWNPIFIVDPNSGALTGLAHDVMEAVGKKLELQIEWTEEASFGTIVEGVVTHRYDVACTGLYRNAARSRRIDFTMPYLYNPMYALARVGETRIKSYEDINDPNIKVSVLEGEAGSIYARQTYTKAKFIAIPQMSDFALVYENVAVKKADVAFGEMASYVEYNEKNPDVLQLLQPNNPAAVYPVVFGLPQNDLPLKVAINSALQELHNDGTIRHLIKKYEKVKGSFLPVAKPYEVSE